MVMSPAVPTPENDCAGEAQGRERKIGCGSQMEV
jgi:hypothetical protein